MALKFFSPQMEFGFWSYTIGICFLLSGLLIFVNSKNRFLRWGALVFGIFLYVDETQQAHECFSEFSRYSPLLYLSGEMLMAIPLAGLWFKENPIQRNDIWYAIGLTSCLCVATLLRFLKIPGHFKIVEELAEFGVAWCGLLYLLKRKRMNIKGKIRWAVLTVLICAHTAFPSVRERACPRVQYWVQKLSYF